MQSDEILTAALEAEAADAKVDATRLYRRIQEARVNPPRRRIGMLMEVAVAATLLVFAGGLLLGRSIAPRPAAKPPLVEQSPIPEGPVDVQPEVEPPIEVPPSTGQITDKNPPPIDPGSSAQYLEAPTAHYENATLGFALDYPTLFEAPSESGTDPVQVVLPFGWGDLTVNQEPPPGDFSLSVLTTKAFDAMRQEHQRYMPVEFGTRELNGREVGYFSYTYISAAAFFTREVYLIPVEDRLYRVTCGTHPGSRVPWAESKPICDKITASLTFDGAEPNAEAAATTPGLVDYEPWGLQLQYPQSFGLPEITAGLIYLQLSDWGELTIERHPSTSASAEVLVAEGVKQIEGQPRHVIIEQGVRKLAGREAGYYSYSAVSAAAGFSKEVYLLPVNDHLFRITCGSVSGSRTPWNEAKPICDQILSTLNIAE